MAFGFTDNEGARLTMSKEQASIVTGVSFRSAYSVASLGAMTTPDDMIQLHFTTPSVAVLGGQSYGTVEVVTAAGALFKLTEAPTGGMASAMGTIPSYNRNRNLQATQYSPMIIYYDGTAATGGTELISEYIGESIYGTTSRREEWVLLPETVYAISLFNTSAVAAAIILHGRICKACN